MGKKLYMGWYDHDVWIPELEGINETREIYYAALNLSSSATKDHEKFNCTANLFVVKDYIIIQPKEADNNKKTFNFSDFLGHATAAAVGGVAGVALLPAAVAVGSGIAISDKLKKRKEEIDTNFYNLEEAIDELDIDPNEVIIIPAISTEISSNKQKFSLMEISNKGYYIEFKGTFIYFGKEINSIFYTWDVTKQDKLKKTFADAGFKNFEIL